MRVASTYIIFMLTLLSIMVVRSNELETNDWTLMKLNLPIIRDDSTSLDLTHVKKVFKDLSEKKIIWVLGKFKVGKSFIIDYVRGDGETTSDPIVNTIGLKIYVNEYFAIIDTEGLMQPIGDNDVFFIKQFLISFMEKTADTLIYVSDQMDVSDIEQYRYFQTIYWGSRINSMFYIHNCKTLSDSNLELYKKRIINYLSLHAMLLTDRSNPQKNIQHLFIPHLETGLFDWLKKLFKGKMIINILGQPINQRDEFTLYNFLQSINDAISSIGGTSLNKIDVDSKSFEIDGFIRSDLDLIPLRYFWCVESKDGFPVLSLFIRNPEILTVKLVNAYQINICVNTITNRFEVVKTCHNIVTPVIIISPDQSSWVIQQSDFGFMVVRLPTPKNVINPIEFTCPDHDLMDLNIKAEQSSEFKTSIWIQAKEYVLDRFKETVDKIFNAIEEFLKLRNEL